jgi:two-component system, sensor histidine kinase and response regulator
MVPQLLIVDDQRENFQVIEVLLSREPYELAYVSSGQAALEYLKQNDPDLILMDIMMPEMNGFELCDRIKRHLDWQHIPIIAITALSSREDLERCLAAGADDFIAKPVDRIELRARISAMLRIRQQYERLHHLVDLQDDLAHMMVHDLRSPLTSIAMSTSVLDRVVQEPLAQKQVQRILASINRLQCMIDSVLMLGKLKSDRMALRLQNLNVAEMLQEAIDDFQLFARQRSIVLNLELPEQSVPVLADHLLIRRVIDNLISNAIKFSNPDNAVIVRVSYPQQSRLRIEVIDQGPGVNPQLQERLFQKFEIDSLITCVKQTGLGLAFCKMATEAHSGQIYVEPNQPRGSIFIVEIDCHPLEMMPIAPEEEAAQF